MLDESLKQSSRRRRMRVHPWAEEINNSIFIHLNWNQEFFLRYLTREIPQKLEL